MYIGEPVTYKKKAKKSFILAWIVPTILYSCQIWTTTTMYVQFLQCSDIIEHFSTQAAQSVVVEGPVVHE